MAKAAEPAVQYAEWWRRAGAAIADALPIALTFGVLAKLYGEFGSTTTTFVGDEEVSQKMYGVTLSGWPAAVLFLVTVLWFGYNWLYLQGTEGKTMGKWATGITVVSSEDGEPIGAGRTLGRQFLHLLDALPCFIGFLWPLWDKNNQTFADKLIGTHVVSDAEGTA